MSGLKRFWLPFVYLIATVQIGWCYFWLTRPYVSTRGYELGTERMPFQGRCLMMLPMRVVHGNKVLLWIAHPLALLHFWFPTQVQPEVLTQALINVICLVVTGWATTRLYCACSHRRLLTPIIYPLVLAVFAATYMLHTVQNFRFIYDLPSLAFFSVAMWLIYARKRRGWFAMLFIVATINRETTLLLLPLYAIDHSFDGTRLNWKKLFAWRTVATVVPLATMWAAWQVFLRFWFYGNRSEFYPRLDWNVKSLLLPAAWPQLLSACGYLLLFVVVMRRRIPNARLQAWQWLLPLWVTFMFSYGILVETRVFGELIPMVVCSAALIAEELLLSRVYRSMAPFQWFQMSTKSASPIQSYRSEKIELIRAIDKARDQMIDTENLSDPELDELQIQYEKMRIACDNRQKRNMTVSS